MRSAGFSVDKTDTNSQSMTEIHTEKKFSSAIKIEEYSLKPGEWKSKTTGQIVIVNSISSEKIEWTSDEMKFTTERTTFEKYYEPHQEEAVTKNPSKLHSL